MKKPQSGQAFLEALLGSGVMIVIFTGLLLLGLGLGTRAVLAHALEERIVCGRSIEKPRTCDEKFRALLAQVPGEARVISVRRKGAALTAKLRWRLLGFVKEIRLEENSPLSE